MMHFLMVLRHHTVRETAAQYSRIQERPLLAESGPSLLSNFHDLNVRFGEKRTFNSDQREIQVASPVYIRKQPFA